VIQGNETYKDIDVFMDNGSFGNDRVLNYRATNISSTQSHPESIMSINGFEILRDMILHVLK
jgi:anthranilate/para-aminobenzoate synthase component II